MEPGGAMNSLRNMDSDEGVPCHRCTLGQGTRHCPYRQSIHTDTTCDMCGSFNTVEAESFSIQDPDTGDYEDFVVCSQCAAQYRALVPCTCEVCMEQGGKQTFVLVHLVQSELPEQKHYMWVRGAICTSCMQRIAPHVPYGGIVTDSPYEIFSKELRTICQATL
jgi:hypothetical protein